MTVARPTEPMLPPRRRPWGLIVAVAVVLVVVAYLALSSVGSAFVYYLTPGELLERGEAGIGQTVRLGGQVVPGSVEQDPFRFVLTDGIDRIPVVSERLPTSSFREGSGAVVEGALGANGVFVASQVIVKHDEQYEAPPPGELPADRDYGDE